MGRLIPVTTPADHRKYDEIELSDLNARRQNVRESSDFKSTAPPEHFYSQFLTFWHTRCIIEFSQILQNSRNTPL